MEPKNPSPLQWQFDEDEDANLLLGEELLKEGLGLLNSLSKSRDQSDVFISLEDVTGLKIGDQTESDFLITNNVQNLNVNASTFTPSKLSLSSEPEPEFSPNYFNLNQNVDMYGQPQDQNFPEIDIQEYTNNLRRLGKEFIKYGIAYLKERKNLKPFYVEYIREQLTERAHSNTLGFTIYSVDLLVDGIIKLIQIDGRLVYDTSYRAKYDVFWLAGNPFDSFAGNHNNVQPHQQSTLPQPIGANGAHFTSNPQQEAPYNSSISPNYVVTQQLQPYNKGDGVRLSQPPPLNVVYSNGVNGQGPFPSNRVQLPVQKIGEMKSSLLQERYDSVVKEIAEDITVNAIKRLQKHSNRKPFRISEIKHSLRNRETLLKHWLVAAEASVLTIMKADVRLLYDGNYQSPKERQIVEVFWLSSVKQPLIGVVDGWFTAPPPNGASSPPVASNVPSGLNVYGQPMNGLSVNLSSPPATSIASSLASSVNSSVSSSLDTATSPKSRAASSILPPPPGLSAVDAVTTVSVVADHSPPVVPHLSALERINKLVMPAGSSGPNSSRSLSPGKQGIADKQVVVSNPVRHTISISNANQATVPGLNSTANGRTSPVPVAVNQTSLTPQTIVVKAVSSGTNHGGLNKGGTSSTGGMTIIRQTTPADGQTSSATVTAIPLINVENVINSVNDLSAIASYLGVVAKMAKHFSQKAITQLESTHNKQPYLVANIRIAIAKSDFESTIAYRIPDQEEFLIDLIDTLREDDRLVYASKNSENLLEGFWLNKQNS